MEPEVRRGAVVLQMFAGEALREPEAYMYQTPPLFTRAVYRGPSGTRDVSAEVRVRAAPVWAGLERGTGTFVLAFEGNPKSIVLEPQKFDAYLEEERFSEAQAARTGGPGREIYSRYVKAAGSVGQAGGAVKTTDVVGMALELVPDRELVGLKATDTLGFRLIWKGAGVPGRVVTLARRDAAQVVTHVEATTDAEGWARFVLVGEGVHLARATVMQAWDGVDADWHSHWASFTFGVGP